MKLTEKEKDEVKRGVAESIMAGTAGLTECGIPEGLRLDANAVWVDEESVRIEWAVNHPSVTVHDLRCVSENTNMFTEDERELFEDKAYFVQSIGWLFAQTREGLTSCELVDMDTVLMKFACGYEQLVNIHLDSYTSIIKDLVKQL